MEVVSLLIYNKYFRDFDNWPFNRGWPLNGGPLNRGSTVYTYFSSCPLPSNQEYWQGLAAQRYLQPVGLLSWTLLGQRFSFWNFRSSNCSKFKNLSLLQDSQRTLITFFFLTTVPCHSSCLQRLHFHPHGPQGTCNSNFMPLRNSSFEVSDHFNDLFSVSVLRRSFCK